MATPPDKMPQSIALAESSSVVPYASAQFLKTKKHSILQQNRRLSVRCNKGRATTTLPLPLIGFLTLEYLKRWCTTGKAEFFDSDGMNLGIPRA